MSVPGKSASYNRGRWWEAYGLRYALGTLLGMGAVYLLLQRIAPALSTAVDVQLKSTATDAISMWVVFAAAGLGYCYLCSAPITVFHAARGTSAAKAGRWATRIWLWFGVACVPAAAVFLFLPVNRICVIGLLALPAVYVLVDQYCCVYRVRKDLRNPTASNALLFYQELSAARAGKGGSSDIRDSYTDLREHANSVFIVLLEISVFCLLSFCLHVGSGGIEAKLFAVLVLGMAWLVPNRLLWGIANDIEADFAKNPEKYTAPGQPGNPPAESL